MAPDATTRAAHRLLCGRLAGLLFMVGSLASIPVNRLFEPAVGARVDWITAVGVGSGIVCFLIPWDRLRAGWLHAVPSIASAEVLLTMWGVGEHAHAYLWFLVLIVVFWAFAFEHRWEVGLHLGVVLLAALYPVATASGADRSNVLAETVLAIPLLLVAAAVVVHLRERLAAAVDALADDARTDPLTGVGNRRLLHMVLGYEMTRHRRNGRDLAVLALDLDGFKIINDTLGHPAGDRVLRAVADALRATVREPDTIVRLGGDEFLVVAPETGDEEAAALVERIHEALPVPAAIGFASFPGDAATAEELLAAADAEQGREKRAHREGSPVPARQ